MSNFGPPPDLDSKVPNEIIYDSVYSKNTAAEIQSSFIPLIKYDSKYVGVPLYGEYIPRIDEKIEEKKDGIEEVKLQNGVIFKEIYQVRKQLGDRTYEVELIGTKLGKGKMAVLKLEDRRRNPQGATLKRHIYTYAEIDKRLDNYPNYKENSHFLDSYQAGIVGLNIGYLVVAKAECNLRELLTKVLLNKPLSRASALHISLQMLQGIHDLHLAGFIHRDIRLQSFFVGSGDNHRRIYLGGFDLAWDRYKDRSNVSSPTARSPRVTPKLTKRSARFQSRGYHLGNYSTAVDDIESWIYLCIFLFSSKLLPWKNAETERLGYILKCRLVNGECLRAEIEYHFRPMLNSLRQCNTVDFPFYADCLTDLGYAWNITGEEPLDWEINNKGKIIPARLYPTSDALLPIGRFRVADHARRKKILSRATAQKGHTKGKKNRNSKTREANIEVTQEEEDQPEEEKRTKVNRKKKEDRTQEFEAEDGPIFEEQQTKKKTIIKKKKDEIDRTQEFEDENPIFSQNVEKKKTIGRKKKEDGTQKVKKVNPIFSQNVEKIKEVGRKKEDGTQEIEEEDPKKMEEEKVKDINE